MTQCIGSPAQEMAEQYLTGGLPEAEAERFEDHYFACNLCHEHLLALKEIRDGLAREPIIVTAPAPGARPVTQKLSLGGRLLAFPVRLALLGSIAAALIVAAVLVGSRQSVHVLSLGHLGGDGDSSASSAKILNAVPKNGQQSPSDEEKISSKNSDGGLQATQDTELASLADLRLPGYQQPQLRGAETADTSHIAFSTGMAAYTQGDCKSALETLTKIPATATDGITAKLYSGLCQLMTRKLDRAQSSFAAVIAVGDTPQLETAEYFLAQTKLLRGDAAGASSWLIKTIALHGDYEERAQKQKALLPDDAKQLPR